MWSDIGSFSPYELRCLLDGYSGGIGFRHNTNADTECYQDVLVSYRGWGLRRVKVHRNKKSDEEILRSILAKTNALLEEDYNGFLWQLIECMKFRDYEVVSYEHIPAEEVRMRALILIANYKSWYKEWVKKGRKVNV